jgi:hypothetical protein
MSLFIFIFYFYFLYKKNLAHTATLDPIISGSCSDIRYTDFLCQKPYPYNGVAGYTGVPDTSDKQLTQDCAIGIALLK